MTPGQESARAAGDLLEASGVAVGRDIALGPLTTYRVGGRAAVFAELRERADVDRLADAVSETGASVLIVGRGSNLLVSDRGFDGVAVRLGAWCEEIVIDGGTVDAGGAVALPVLARRTVASGLAGFEWAVGVPGSVGGAVRMNAGGHGSDMAERLVSVELVDLAIAAVTVVPANELGLGFRRSALDDRHVVLAARLELEPGDRSRGEGTLAEIVRWRRTNQPGGQNAGSVFVNPDPGRLSAGEVIDGLGLRGFRIGSAEVSVKHANFIQADEGGSADDVRRLIDHVRRRVLDERGISLRSEIRLIGFEEGSA
jgi:UDP-N-acetylmuramate dehydrogenase